MKDQLLNYYKKINHQGSPIGYNWNDMEKIGLGDPCLVFKLNNELITAGKLKRTHPKNSYGDNQLWLI